MATFVDIDLTGKPSSGAVVVGDLPGMTRVVGSGVTHTASTVNGVKAVAIGPAFGAMELDLIGGKTKYRFRTIAQWSGASQTNHAFMMTIYDAASAVLGDFQIRNIAGKPIWNRWNFVAGSPQPNWAADTPWRFEWYWEIGVETILYIWTDPSSTGSPDYTITRAATSGTPIKVGIGNNSGVGIEILYSAIAISDGEAIGPYVAPAVAVVPDFVNTAEGGTAGVDQTAANSGGASGNAFEDPATATGTGTVKFSNEQGMHGGLSYKIVKGTTNVCYMVTDPADLAPSFAFRGYVRYASLPSGNTTLFGFRSATGATNRAAVGVDNAGKITVMNGSDLLTFTSAINVISPNIWYRFEIKAVVDPSLGTMSIRIYEGDSLTPVYSQDLTAQNFGAATGVGYIRMGYGSGGTTGGDLWLDDIAYKANTSAFIGPATGSPFSPGGSGPSGPVVRGIINPARNAITAVTLRGVINTARTAIEPVTLRANPVAVPSRYASVNDMLSKKPFMWAHRGGSRDYPEMSAYAYAQSAALGYGVLEFSVAKSSDGVYFGLHDDTLNRTSVLGATPVVSAQSKTWAEISAGYTISGTMAANNPGQANQPYMKLEDFLSAYGGTHILVIDPKSLVAEAGDVLDYCLSRVPANRLIGKYYGSSSAFAAACAFRGIKSWGYFYDSDYITLADRIPQWDILGINYDAAQPVFDTMLSYGKPLVAHITMSKAASDMGLAKGAQGLQVGAVINSAPLLATEVSYTAPVLTRPTLINVAGYTGQNTNANTVMPAGIIAGDRILIFAGHSSAALPDGTGIGTLTRLNSAISGPYYTDTLTKVAEGTESGSTLGFYVAGAGKWDISVLVYRNVGAVEATSSNVSAGASTHTSPTVTSGGSLRRLVTYFGERSGATASEWTKPPSAEILRTGVGDAGAARINSITVDTEVEAGTVGGLVATTTIATTRAIVVSVSLTPGLMVAAPPGPAGTVESLWVGTPAQDGFVVVARSTASTSCRLAISTSPVMASPSYVAAVIPDAQGYVRFGVTGKAANTKYYYQLADTPSGGSESLVGSIGSVKTLPSTSVVPSFTVAVGGCVQQTTIGSGDEGMAIAEINAAGPDFFIHLGDFYYTGTTSTDPVVYRNYYQNQIANFPGLKTMLANVPTFYAISDHESGLDNADNNNAWNIVHDNVYKQVAPYAGGPNRYHAWTVGRVRFILLDTRTPQRSPGLMTDGPTKTMLGATQLAWLKEQLDGPQLLKIILSDPAWMGPPSLTAAEDKWWAYANERQVIIDYITAGSINVELWHSDSHGIGYSTPVGNSYGGFPVIGSAPLANVGGGRNVAEFDYYYNLDTGSQYRQYVGVTFTDDGTTLTRTAVGRDSMNAIDRFTNVQTYAEAAPPVVGLPVAPDTFWQDKSAALVGTSYTFPVASAVAAGKLFVVNAATLMTTGSTLSISDSKGNTYAKINNDASGTGVIVGYSTITNALTTSDTITVSTTGASMTRAAVTAMVWDWTYSRIEKPTWKTPTSTTAQSSNAADVTGRAVVIGIHGMQNSGRTPTVGAGWTAYAKNGTTFGSGDRALLTAYRTVDPSETGVIYPITYDTSGTGITAFIAFVE